MKRTTIHHIIAGLTIACAPITNAYAQQDNQPATFSIMTLNVDGLPGKFLFFDVNAEGPQTLGSERISKYMATKNCDMMCLQENFNYRWEIWSHLFIDYNHDEWSGGISLEEQNIDFAHLQNLKFECDGLNTLWKTNIEPLQQERVAWNQSFGKFSHDFDDIITKGFRRHEMKLDNGFELVVYNMHMDASSDRDEQRNNDAKDREARQSQWVQLREHILDRLDSRPVVVTGDMNSFFYRDDIKSVFIDAIEETGQATVKDAWAEVCNGGEYPTLGNEKNETETLDHILYVNPTMGMGLELADFDLDKEGYTIDGKPLGDHYPLIATFQLLDEAGSPIERGKSVPTTDVTTLTAYPTQIQCQGGQVTVQGLADKTEVGVYTLGGIEAGNAIIAHGTATINTTIGKGEAFIVKIGEKSVKMVMK